MRTDSQPNPIDSYRLQPGISSRTHKQSLKSLNSADFKGFLPGLDSRQTTSITPLSDTSVDYTPGLIEKPVLSREQQLRVQAQKWVGQAFFGTMLKQMRDSPFKSELFSGGRGGEVFNSLLDQHLSEKMSSGVGSSLVNSIVDRITKAHPASGANTSPASSAKVPEMDNVNEDLKQTIQSWRQRVASAR